MIKFVFIIYVPPTIAVMVRPLSLPPVEEVLAVETEGDDVGITWSEESVVPVTTTHKHTINQFYMYYIASVLDILVGDIGVTATLVRVYFLLWGDGIMPLGGELLQVGLTNTSCSPLTVPFTITIDPDTVDEIHLGDIAI